MNNQAAQTMPELPEPEVHDAAGFRRAYTADQMHQYAREYAASQTAGAAAPGRYFADGPQGHFFADDLQLARDLVNLYDKDDDWTITDLRNPTGAAPAASGEEDDMCPNCVTPWKCNGPHESTGGASVSGGEDGPNWRYAAVSALEYLEAGDTENAIGMLKSAISMHVPQPQPAASVSERAREFLAAEYDNEGVHGLAESIRAGTFTTHLDQCSINAITNALASAPDGFALVPVEPTEAMKDAGDYSKWNYDDAADIYKAMLRASGYAARGTKELVIALEQALTQQRGAVSCIEQIVRDACEMDPANPDHPDTIAIRREDLIRIITRAIDKAPTEIVDAVDDPNGTCPTCHQYLRNDAGVPCKEHPDAPHGFDRTASHSIGRYVCECEGWSATTPHPSADAVREDGNG